ncbi:unnamed protein product [Anisakis simplex]|uniref:Uncharacterized protein n=1 Tax=Anisakis simplex TaxID=6269 RepID=A0A0M3JH22_ANISI|nr:unnamed protein product [Anisakis simplex]
MWYRKWLPRKRSTVTFVSSEQPPQSLDRKIHLSNSSLALASSDGTDDSATSLKLPLQSSTSEKKSDSSPSPRRFVKLNTMHAWKLFVSYSTTSV